MSGFWKARSWHLPCSHVFLRKRSWIMRTLKTVPATRWTWGDLLAPTWTQEALAGTQWRSHQRPGGGVGPKDLTRCIKNKSSVEGKTSSAWSYFCKGIVTPVKTFQYIWAFQLYKSCCENYSLRLVLTFSGCQMISTAYLIPNFSLNMPSSQRAAISYVATTG